MLRGLSSRRTRALVAGLVFCAAPQRALAAGPLGPRGTPIQTSDYSLDLFQGPVLASSRVTGMAGAYSALAEGAEGIPVNAASASQRPAYSTTRTDYDLTFGVTFPSSVKDTDFDNNGSTGFGYNDFVFATVGGLLQHDHFGVGSNLSVQNYSLGAPPELSVGASGVRDLTVRVFKFDAVASYGFFDDQLHLGGGLRGAVFNAVDTSETIETLLFGTYGLGAQAGVLWRPRTLPLRLGGTVRSPVIGAINASPNVREDPATGDRLIGRFYLPSGVALPWELEWGAAVQIGKRPLNLGWTDEATIPIPKADARRLLRRRYRAIAREKLLLSFSMLVTGPTAGALGVESMLAQRVDLSGERASVTMRAGAEAELVPNLLQLRAGSYMEPSRFRGSGPRLHATTGFEMRVLAWSVFGLFPEDNVFRISGAVDTAREYFGWSLGIGSWY